MAAAVAASLLLSFARSARSQSAVSRCRDAIAKQGEKFFKKKMALVQRCEKLVLKGVLSPPCPDSASLANIEQARQKSAEKIRDKCDDVDPQMVGWPQVCAAPCPETATTTIEGVIECVDCVVEDAVDDLIASYCPDSAPEPDKRLRRCKQTVGKAASKCVSTVVGQLNRCAALVRAGKAAGPCPDARTEDKTQKAEYKRGRAIAKACASYDPQSDLGFGVQCPDGVGSCSGIAIDTLDSLLDCIDCLSDGMADRLLDVFTVWGPALLACGDGVVNQPGEQCDPPDDRACQGECRQVCACPIAPDHADLLCQRAIEQGGALYAEQVLQAVESCAAPGEPASIHECLASQAVQDQLQAVRTQWGIDATAACSATHVHRDLGYLRTCAAAPSSCTFTSDVLDVPGASNDILDCLACRVGEELGQVGEALFADRSESGQCHGTLGRGGVGLVRTLLGQIEDCLSQPGGTSIAACFQPDEAGWRAQAENDCAGVDPFGEIGYPGLCSGVEPILPGMCADQALPCTFAPMSQLSAGGADNDLLDCFTCRIEEAALAVARLLYGANLCCAGGGCNTVLSRYACREVNGGPMSYRVDTLRPWDPIAAVHGFDVRPDGTLYVASHYGKMLKVAADGSTVTEVGTTDWFVTGVAVDHSGDIYYTVRYGHQVFRMKPSGRVSVFAGTGVPGHSGDGGAATLAQIVAPEGITIDAAGNVYFTESGLLSFAWGGPWVDSERVRMVDTYGNIHTVAGSTYGTAGAGGPAIDAQLALPYSLWRAFDGSVVIGEDGAMRVLRIEPGGLLTHIAGRAQAPVAAYSGYGGRAVAARFYHTCGLGADPDGNVLVGAMEDNRVALVDRLGSVIGIGGTGEGASRGDPAGDGGPALLARGLCCEEVEVSADGRIFCSDLSTSRIRVLRRDWF